MGEAGIQMLPLSASDERLPWTLKVTEKERLGNGGDIKQERRKDGK